MNRSPLKWLGSKAGNAAGIFANEFLQDCGWIRSENAGPCATELISSEISDFCAGLGQPGEPETPEEIQQSLLNRILPLLVGQPSGLNPAAPGGKPEC